MTTAALDVPVSKSEEPRPSGWAGLVVFVGIVTAVVWAFAPSGAASPPSRLAPATHDEATAPASTPPLTLAEKIAELSPREQLEQARRLANDGLKRRSPPELAYPLALRLLQAVPAEAAESRAARALEREIKARQRIRVRRPAAVPVVAPTDERLGGLLALTAAQPAAAEKRPKPSPGVEGLNKLSAADLARPREYPSSTPPGPYQSPNHNRPKTRTPPFYAQPTYSLPNPRTLPCAENRSCYGDLNSIGRPKTVHVNGYFRKDGTYVRSHYRSRTR